MARLTRREKEFLKAMDPIIEQLVERGRIEGARAALRTVLAKRGLRTTAKHEAKIDACSTGATLRLWLEQAIDATSAAAALR